MCHASRALPLWSVRAQEPLGWAAWARRGAGELRRVSSVAARAAPPPPPLLPQQEHAAGDPHAHA